VDAVGHAEATMGRVVIADPERMNLLGLILRSILERNLESAACQRMAARLEGRIGVKAGEMAVTLECHAGSFRIVRGWEGSAQARVRGELGSFVRIATGGGLARPVLTRKIGFSGNPLLLLRLTALLRPAAQ
jgi:ubiquinone biosynthesis protein UbiJ